MPVSKSALRTWFTTALRKLVQPLNNRHQRTIFTAQPSSLSGSGIAGGQAVVFGAANLSSSASGVVSQGTTGGNPVWNMPNPLTALGTGSVGLVPAYVTTPSGFQLFISSIGVDLTQFGITITQGSSPQLVFSGVPVGTTINGAQLLADDLHGGVAASPVFSIQIPASGVIPTFTTLSPPEATGNNTPNSTNPSAFWTSVKLWGDDIFSVEDTNQ